MATTNSSITMWITQSRHVICPIAWTIDNMSHRDNTVTSPFFKYNSRDSFMLELHSTKEDYLSLTITSALSRNPSVKVYIVTAGNVKKCLYESPKNATWAYINYAMFKSSLTIDKFISRAALYNPVNGYLPGDKLTIIVEFGFLDWDKNVQGTFEEPVEQMKSITVDSATREAYGQLLATGKLSDVTLIVGEKAIPAHKAILAIRSPVLAAMFEGDTKEAQENRVKIPDVKVGVFEQMLDFIYTGAVSSLNQQTAEELLVAADKYQVDGLKAICENYLCSQLSPETAPNLFLFAEAVNAPMLMECAIQFINSQATDVFKAMTDEPNQLLEMIRILAVKNEEKNGK